MSPCPRIPGRLIPLVTLLLLAWATQALAQQDAPTAKVAGETQTVIRGLLGDELTAHWYPRALDKEHGGVALQKPSFWVCWSWTRSTAARRTGTLEPSASSGNSSEPT